MNLEIVVKIRSSLVNIVTRLLAGRPGSIPGKNRERVQAGSGLHSASYPVDTEGSFPGVKKLGL